MMFGPLLKIVTIVALFYMPTTVSKAADDAILHKLERVMKTQTEDGFWGIVFVKKGDKVLLKKGYGIADRKTHTPMTADTIISSGSLSKQVTATAAIFLAEQGKLSLNDTLGKYFKDVPADKRDITIQQLLSHTGGIEEWVFPDDFTPIPKKVWLEKVFSAKLVLPPNTGYHYSNDGITLVAIIIEKVTGQPFRDYIKQTFFKPLGMKHTGWFDDAVFDDPAVTVATGYRNGKDSGAPNEWSSPSWALIGNGGILWSLDDMHTWHKAVQGELLSPQGRTKLFKKIVTDPERTLYPSETKPMHYGLGWRLGTSSCGDTRIGHTGTGLSHNVDFRYYRDRDIVIYVASNRIDEAYNSKAKYYARNTAEALSQVFMANC